MEALGRRERRSRQGQQCQKSITQASRRIAPSAEEQGYQTEWVMEDGRLARLVLRTNNLSAIPARQGRARLPSSIGERPYKM